MKSPFSSMVNLKDQDETYIGFCMEVQNAFFSSVFLWQTVHSVNAHMFTDIIKNTIHQCMVGWIFVHNWPILIYSSLLMSLCFVLINLIKSNLFVFM